MKQIFIALTLVLLFTITSCDRQKSKQAGFSPEAVCNLHPYLSSGDPNISRAFRIACGDIISNVVPLQAMASYSVTPVSQKRWDDLSERLVSMAGTAEIISPDVAFLVGGLDYGLYQFDVTMHSWDGASFFEPDAVKNAMFATLVAAGDSSLRSGDFITGFGWTVGAWKHYLITGDRLFLKVALEASLGAFEHYEKNEFDPELNLFRGPALICDGISSYPDFWAQGLTGKGHIIKWPEVHPDKKVPVGLGLPMHALSTNCINYQAYLVAAEMQEELGLPVDTALAGKAGRLKNAINKHFWREDAGIYRYLVDPFGGSDQQEGFGNAFAVLFGIANREQADRIFQNMHITPQGIPINWPVYPRYASRDGSTYGNHNATVWPPILGVWAEVSALEGRKDLFSNELKKHADRGCIFNQFAEVYHPITGEPYGGIQEGRTARAGMGLRAFIAARLGGDGEATPEALEELFPEVKGKEGINQWQYCSRNTFSSTAYLRMVLNGLCGMKLDTGGITFRPKIPEGMGPVDVYDLRYRQSVLEIHIKGEGSEVTRITVNGIPSDKVHATATGKQVVEIEMGS